VEIGAREGKEEEYRSSSRRVGGEGGGAAAVEGRGATPSFHDSNLCERSSYCGVRNEKGEVKGRSRNSEGSRVPPPPPPLESRFPSPRLQAGRNRGRRGEPDRGGPSFGSIIETGLLLCTM
jgi:hypothetical protein